MAVYSHLLRGGFTSSSHLLILLIRAWHGTKVSLISLGVLGRSDERRVDAQVERNPVFEAPGENLSYAYLWACPGPDDPDCNGGVVCKDARANEAELVHTECSVVACRLSLCSSMSRPSGLRVRPCVGLVNVTTFGALCYKAIWPVIRFPIIMPTMTMVFSISVGLTPCTYTHSEIQKRVHAIGSLRKAGSSNSHKEGRHKNRLAGPGLSVPDARAVL